MEAERARVHADPDLSSALRAAFGDRAILNLVELRGGFSNATLLAFNVEGEEEGSAAFVMRKGGVHGDVERAAHEITCLRIASERGVAPRLHYANAETGVSIIDRVEGKPLRGHDPAVLERVAATLRHLHEGPAFPAGPKPMQILRYLDQQCAAASSGEGLPADLVRTVDELTALTARDAHAAPCHHDLNPNNVFVTPDRAVVFIDWAMAGAGDPFIDLAQLGVFAFRAPESRDALLDAYLGRRANEEERARAIVARVIALAFYSSTFLFTRAQLRRGSSSMTTPSSNGDAPPLAEMLAALGASPERTDPGAVGLSLLNEMRRERESDSFARAKERLAARAFR